MVTVDELEADQRRALDHLAPIVERVGLVLRSRLAADT
jgi:hypothetical protein